MLIQALFWGILGAASGSFVSALVWRLRTGKDWVTGRSQCPACGHKLSVADLVPIFSWLSLRGRCRYCKKPISAAYPLIELAGAITFSASYIYWPGGFGTQSAKLAFATWIITSIGLLALAVYDLKWQLLPSKILYPTAAIAFGLSLLGILAYQPAKLAALGKLGAAVAVASGIFWVIFQATNGKGIGYGDVRLGLVTGAVLGTPGKSLLMIFLASILGSISALPGVITGRRSLKSKIPFGPFLILACAAAVLFGDSLLEWYKNLLI